MREFFGLHLNEDGEYSFLREAEGAWSWQHITFVSLLLIAMTLLAIYLGFSLISLLRIYLFKLLRIHKLVDYIADLPEKSKQKK